MPELYDAIVRVVAETRDPEMSRESRQQKLEEFKALLSITPEQWALAACHDGPQID